MHTLYTYIMLKKLFFSLLSFNYQAYNKKAFFIICLLITTKYKTFCWEQKKFVLNILSYFLYQLHIMHSFRFYCFVTIVCVCVWGVSSYSALVSYGKILSFPLDDSLIIKKNTWYWWIWILFIHLFCFQSDVNQGDNFIIIIVIQNGLKKYWDWRWIYLDRNDHWTKW